METETQNQTKTQTQVIELVKQNYELQKAKSYQYGNKLPFMLQADFEKQWNEKATILQSAITQACITYDQLFESKKNAEFRQLLTFTKANFLANEKDNIAKRVKKKKNYSGFYLDQNALQNDIKIAIQKVADLYDGLLVEKFNNNELFEELVEFGVGEKQTHYYGSESIKAYSAGYFIISKEHFVQKVITQQKEDLKIKLDYENNTVIVDILFFVTSSYKFTFSFEDEYKNILKQFQPYYNLLTNFETAYNKQKHEIFATQVLNTGYVETEYNNRINEYRNLFAIYNNGKTFRFKHEKGIKGLQTAIICCYTVTTTDVIVLITDELNILRNTTLNIRRQVQRVDVRNNVEVHIGMHKHFEPEIIITNSYEEAKALADKIQKGINGPNYNESNKYRMR